MDQHHHRCRRGRVRSHVALGAALLALAASTGGTAYAAERAAKNSVVSKSIKNGQVKSQDLKDGGVRAADLARTVRVTATSPATYDGDGAANGGFLIGMAEATATCPPGTRVISGGARWVDGHLDANTYLHTNTVAGNGWYAKGIVDIGAQGSVRLQVTAVCQS